MIEPVVIGLGGNVGGDAAIRARFVSVRAALEARGPVRSAPLYASAPIGPAQPAFLNTALCVRISDIPPEALLATLNTLEAALGRDRASEVRWGPRTIDLDVLVWGDRVIRTATLDVPHPRLGARKFALAPLVALLGDDFIVPGLGAAGAVLHAVDAQDCAVVAEHW